MPAAERVGLAGSGNVSGAKMSRGSGVCAAALAIVVAQARSITARRQSMTELRAAYLSPGRPNNANRSDTGAPDGVYAPTSRWRGWSARGSGGSRWNRPRHRSPRLFRPHPAGFSDSQPKRPEGHDRHPGCAAEVPTEIAIWVKPRITWLPQLGVARQPPDPRPVLCPSSPAPAAVQRCSWRRRPWSRSSLGLHSQGPRRWRNRR